MKTINRAAAENRAAAAAAAARCFGLLFWLYFCLQTSVFICPAGRSLRRARARVGPRTAPGRRRPPPCQAARKGDGGGWDGDGRDGKGGLGERDGDGDGRDGEGEGG